MYILCKLALMVSMVAGTVIDDPFTAIINGERASILDYPFYAHLRYIEHNSLLCGGSIIRQDVILTAAHCISDTINFNVYVGVSDENDIANAEPYTVKKIINHPLYFGISFFDMAIVKLEKNITLTDKTQVIEMAKENPPEGEEVVIIGFGKPQCNEFSATNPNGQCRNDESEHLRYAFMHTTSVNLGLIGSDGENQNACYGDSGGPMIYEGKLVGIASRVDRHDCSGGNTYTSVSSNKKWIRRQLKK